MLKTLGGYHVVIIKKFPFFFNYGGLRRHNCFKCEWQQFLTNYRILGSKIILVISQNKILN